jgi:hypothetical protein
MSSDDIKRVLKNSGNQLRINGDEGNEEIMGKLTKKLKDLEFTLK